MQRQSKGIHQQVEESPTNVDPFLLDFGTSVNVNEDLRRAIRTEVLELDDSLVSLNSAVKNEQRTEAQLKEDLSHAHSEMRSLSRGATEQLDNAEVHSKLVHRLKESLIVELATSAGAHCEEASSQADSLEPKTNNAPRSDLSGSHSKTFDDIKNLSETTRKVKLSIKEDLDFLEGTKKAKKALEEATVKIRKDISDARLHEVLETLQGETETVKLEKENETERMRAMRASIQQIRLRCGEYAQHVADRANQLNLQRCQHDLQEANILKLQSQEEEEIQILQSAASVAKSHRSSISAQLTQLNQQLDDVDSKREKREKQAVEKKKLLNESQILLEMKESLCLEVDQAKKKCEEASEALIEAKVLMKKVAEAKDSNDRVEKEKIMPGKLELNDLAKQAEVFAREINELHEKIRVEKERNNKEFKEAENIANSLSEDLAKLKMEREGKQSKLSHFVRIRDESKENWEREASECENLEKEYRLASQAEQSRIDVAKQKRQEEHSARIKSAEAEADQHRSEIQRRLQVLKIGAKLVDDSNESVRRLMEDIG